jgi:hypothetical protein
MTYIRACGARFRTGEGKRGAWRTLVAGERRRHSPVVARKGGHDRERREERGRECTEKEIGLQGLLFIYASETVFFLAHTKKANSPAGQPKCILFSITSVLRFKIIYFTIFQRYSMYPTKGNMERTT